MEEGRGVGGSWGGTGSFFNRFGKIRWFLVFILVKSEDEVRALDEDFVFFIFLLKCLEILFFLFFFMTSFWRKKIIVLIYFIFSLCFYLFF